MEHLNSQEYITFVDLKEEVCIALDFKISTFYTTRLGVLSISFSTPSSILFAIKLDFTFFFEIFYVILPS